MGNVKIHLEAAISRENLVSALHIANAWGQAVFGAMDGKTLVKAEAATEISPVYFYEPG
ncbi:MAG: hypothetical protein WCY82_04645 [Desulfotomaculaceae bacterium]